MRFSAKINFITLLFALIGTHAHLQAQKVYPVWENNDSQGLIAQIEDRLVTFEDVRRELAPLVDRVQKETQSRSEFESRMTELYREVIQSFVDREIILKAFKKKEYNFPSSYVDDEYNRMLIEDFNNDRSAFIRQLESQGKNKREFRTELRESMIISVMRGKISKEQSGISPERIENYYIANKVQFFQEEAIKMRLILLRPSPTTTVEDNLKLAQSIIENVRSGGSFAENAMKHSQDTRKSKGGDWGWMQRAGLREDLSNAAFALREKEISEPVVLKDQVFLIYVDEKKPEAIQPLNWVNEQIETLITNQLSRQAQTAWLERLRKDAYIRYF
jgi:peptidyl-prolyl cis-trans isomerase SurA